MRGWGGCECVGWVGEGMEGELMSLYVLMARPYTYTSCKLTTRGQGVEA